MNSTHGNSETVDIRIPYAGEIAMLARPHRFRAKRLSAPRWTLLALVVPLMALLAAIPTAPASAETKVAPDLSAGNISLSTLKLPLADLEGILATLPIEDLGLKSAELEKIVAEVSKKANSENPLLGLLSGELTKVLSGLLKNPRTSANEIVSSTNGLLTGLLGGNQIDLEGILGALSPTQLSTVLNSLTGALGSEGATGITKLLSTLTGGLDAEQLGSLEGMLGSFVGALSSGELTALQAALTALLGGGTLTTGELGSILKTLQGVLSGASLTQLEGLLKNLGALSPAELEAQLKSLLSGLNASQVGTLLAGLFGQLKEPSQLETVVGDLLGDLGSLTPTSTPEELASKLGLSVNGLAEGLGTPTEGLPTTLDAVTGSLGPEGPLLSLLSGLKGLNLSLLGGGEGGKGEEGKGGGSGEGKGSGEGGGGGGGGESGAGGGNGGEVSLVVITPAAQVLAPAPQAASPTPAVTPSKTTTRKKQVLTGVKILSHRVHGDIATLVVKVPSAGKLTVKGGDVKSIARQLDKAQRVTLRLKLSRAGTASLHRHHNRLRVKIKASFKRSSGANSSAKVKVSFA
jgi:hypothetical protein